MAAPQSTKSDPCSALSNMLPGLISTSTDAAFTTSLKSYFFQQETTLVPICIVSPRTVQDVSLIVKSLSESGAKAAVRGCGHTPFAGAANIDGGVTIDLSGLKTVTVGQVDASTGLPPLRQPDSVSSPANRGSVSGANSIDVVSVGGGTSWGDVYRTLQPLSKVAVGGRGSSLGVGGLATGGGISFFSPERGFACDSIVNMEVVLANGSIVNANGAENIDLFQALKGGSNNFGVVTRFDLRTFPQGKFWGGFISYPGDTVPQQLAAFEGFMQASTKDPYAEIICATGYVGAYQMTVVSNGFYYTKPIANPAIFQPFTSIQPQLTNTTRISDNLDFITEVETNQAKGARAIYVNTVFRPTNKMILEAHRLWSATTDSIKAVAGISYFFILQRLPAILPGNSLGLEVSDEPLVLCLLSVTWTNAQDDETINRVTKQLIDDIDSASKAEGAFVDFKYLNYAADFQDPINSYGAISKGNLQAASTKYDPKGFFQNGVPGGFKLFPKAR